MLNLNKYFFFQIFNEPVKVNATPKVDSKNNDYKRSGGDVEVIKANFLMIIFISKCSPPNYQSLSILISAFC